VRERYIEMMRYPRDMLEFIQGKCEAAGTDPRKFVHIWIKSSRNPCSICDGDKTKCSYYKDLVAKGAIFEGEAPP
jgi:hypothetical protein